MSAVRKVAVVHMLVAALAVPPLAHAASGDDPAGPGGRRESAAPAPAAEATVVLPRRPLLLQEATMAAAIKLARAEAAQVLIGPRPVPGRRPTRVRAQGGTGQMVTMLVTTVVGLAGTIYMVKYLRDQNKESTTDGGSNRVR